MSKCHRDCQNFAKASYGTGSCKVSKSPVVPTEEACKDLKEKQPLIEALKEFARAEAGLSPSFEEARKLDKALPHKPGHEEVREIMEEQLADADSPENVEKVKELARIEAGIYPETEKKETCGVCQFFEEGENAEDDEGVEGHCQKNDEPTNSDDEACSDFQKVKGEEFMRRHMKEALRTATTLHN